MAHDLGTVTAALALRADALRLVIPPEDVTAFQSLAADLRDHARLARLIRGPQGADTLSPLQRLPINDWWRVVSHVTVAALPRGVVVHATLNAAVLTALRAHLYSLLWLSACKALAEEGVQAPCTIELVSGRVGGLDAPGLTATCPLASFPVRTRRRGRGRWQQYAERIAEQAEMPLTWWAVDGEFRVWSCADEPGIPTRSREDQA